MSLSGTGKRYSVTRGRETEEKEKNNSEIYFSGKQRKKKLPNRNKILTKKTIIDKTKPKK